MSPRDHASVLGQIEEAFGDLPYPGDDHLIAPSSLQTAEGQRLYNDWKGRDWRSLSLQELRHHAESIFFLTPEAFRYYLPAYLSASVRDSEGVDIIPETLAFALTPPAGDDPVASKKQARIAAFDDRQRRAIAAFLEFLASQGDELDAAQFDKALAFYAGK